MLSGVWASLPDYGVGFASGPTIATAIKTLPWDPSNTDLYFGTVYGGIYDFFEAGARRVLPASLSTFFMSMYYAVQALPFHQTIKFLDIQDSGVTTVVSLWLTPTGVIQVFSNATLVASTSGPVIVAQTATHLEMKLVPATGVFQLYANGVQVLNLTGLAISASNVGQFVIGQPYMWVGYYDNVMHYYGNIIVRSLSGTRNNAITGDRRVATLLVNADDAANQGWTPRPLRRFGTGILDLTSGSAIAVSAPSTTVTNLGSGNYTLETSLRFQLLPGGTGKAVIFGKWDEAGNKRSYQLYKGGPSLNSGATVFQISTAGTAGTATIVLSTTAWVPVVNTYYHVAVVRLSGVVTLYVDGVVIASAADAATYYVGTALTTIGGEMTGTSSVVAATSFDGWMDETRFTAGVARYTGAFTPPVAAFPRGAGPDSNWASVALISSFDNGVVADESANALVLTKRGNAVAITPSDGDFGYQVLVKPVVHDDAYLEAGFTQASGTYTLTGLPANNDTVTLATTNGSAPAIYTWKTTIGAAFTVLIGADTAASITNLISAVNAAAGAGTLYGTGTTANNDVTATTGTTTSIMAATAKVAGTAGNALASTRTGTAGAWGAATLTGGANIPGYSQFLLGRLPSNTNIVDSITMVTRAWKTDAGTSSMKTSFRGAGGAVVDGATVNVSTVPTVRFDTLEADPDVPGNPLTPTSVTLGKIRVTRVT